MKCFKAPAPKQSLFSTAQHVESGEFVKLVSWEEAGNTFQIRFIDGRSAIVEAAELTRFVL